MAVYTAAEQNLKASLYIDNAATYTHVWLRGTYFVQVAHVPRLMLNHHNNNHDNNKKDNDIIITIVITKTLDAT